MTAARPPRTRAQYAGDREHFSGWCTQAGPGALPVAVATVRPNVTDLEAVREQAGAAAYQPATLARCLIAIAAAHRDAGLPSPTRDSSLCRRVF